MARTTIWRFVMASGLVLITAGCEDGMNFDFLKGDGNRDPSAPSATRSAGETQERDVEAPEIFKVEDAGLWDGRPSLGGVWVAHPDVTSPDRVIIRNTTNGKSVVGALFRREREAPGPELQVSSDTAEALGIIAGQPTGMSVIALRREEIELVVEPETIALDEPETIEQTTIDPIAAASAAIDASEPEIAAETIPTPAPAAAAPAPAPASALEKPYIQIGIFSEEGNAQETATALRTAGIVPSVLDQSSNGRSFWRVVVGPAQSSTERAALLDKVKGLGFEDSYFVTN